MFPQKRVDIVHSIASSFSPMKMLDIGCGACTVADIFEQYGHDLEVTDISDHRTPDKWRSRFTKSKAMDISLDGFDSYILAGLLYHLSSESQVALCSRFKGKLVFLDTHYVSSEGKGAPRGSTASSEPSPVIPSIAFIRTTLFPGHFLLQTETHVDDRSWFVCIPKTKSRRLAW
jgi:hypothetical protein